MGLLIGSAYIGGVGARQSVDRSQAQSRLAERSSPPLHLRGLQAPLYDLMQDLDRPVLRARAVPAAYAPVQGDLASTLRDRFRLALAITRSVARPFRFPDRADHAGEAHCLTQAVYYEARGESPSGQAAVAQVVLNRVRHPAFPKTVCGVVYQRSGQGCQFSFACNGSMHALVEPQAWRRAETVATRALGGAVMADIGEATQFHASGSGDGWASGLLKVAQIGEHVFYRIAGRAGSAAMFRQRTPPSLSASGDAPPASTMVSLQARVDGPRLIQTAQPLEIQTGPSQSAVSPQTALKAGGATSSAANAASPPPPAKPDETASKSTIVAGL